MTHPMQHDPTSLDRVVDFYDAKVIGAPFKILLVDGYTIETDLQTGKIMTEIEDLPGLVAAVVRSRVLHPRKLSGDDLKFIRSALCLKAKIVAQLLGMTPENYSRCEHGTKVMSEVTEKYYRQNVYLSVLRRNRIVNETLAEHKNHIKVSSEEAQKVVEAFQKIFLDMKIENMRLVGEELCFTFCRRCCGDITQHGNDDGKWHDKPCQAA